MNAKVHAIYSPEPDLDTAIDFLQTLNPDGRQCLSAIREGVVADRMFEAGLWQEKRQLMAKWAAEKRNVYVLVNEPKAGAIQREKKDIAYIRAVFSDTDNKGVRDKALATIDDPTACQSAFVNDSGGGIHTFFILDTKVAVTPATQDMAENCGRGLREYFSGDAVQDISRIMRVPGTVNYLDAKKRARGRQIALSTVLAKGPGRVTLEDMLRDYPPPAGGASTEAVQEDIRAAMAEIDMAAVEAAGGNYEKLSVGLRARFEKSRAYLSGLWAQGIVKGDDVSGSAHVYRLGLMMHEDGFSGTEFGSVADCWMLVKPTNVEHRQLGRVWAKTAPGAQAAAAFKDAPDEIPETPPEVEIFDIKPACVVKPPYRKWLYAKRLIRGYLSSTVAAGGTGKSSLAMVEAVSMAMDSEDVRRDLLKVGIKNMPRVPLRVLIWNGEDPQSELDLRLYAIRQHYAISDVELGGRLFLVSGRDYPLAVRNGMARLRKTIEARQIDVVIIDPFVASHGVPENDNMAIDAVAKEWSRIAEQYGCAVDLVHHIRKPINGGRGMELSVDDARGASALINASRNARVLSGMPESVATSYAISNRRAYFAIQHDATKANMVPGMVGTDWFHFSSVALDNGEAFPGDGGPPIDGDNVGVVERWFPSRGLEENSAKIREAQIEVAKRDFRAHSQSPDWVGIPIARVLELDEKDHFVRTIIKLWLKKGWLKSVWAKGENRHEKEFVTVGNIPPDEA